MDRKDVSKIYGILAAVTLVILTYFIVDLTGISTMNIAYELKIVMVIIMGIITIFGFGKFVKSMDERPVQLGH